MFGHRCYNMLLSQFFSLLRGGLVLCAVLLHVGYLNSFKWWGQGSGLTKAGAHCCLIWRFFSKQMLVVKGRLNNTSTQASCVPNCIFLFQGIASAFVYWEIQSHQVKHQAEKELQIDSCFQLIPGSFHWFLVLFWEDYSHLL